MVKRIKVWDIFWESCSTEVYRSTIQCGKRTFQLGTLSGELTVPSSLLHKPSCRLEWKLWEDSTTFKSQLKRCCLKRDNQAWSAFEEATDSAAGGLKPRKPSTAGMRILDFFSLYFIFKKQGGGARRWPHWAKVQIQIIIFSP